MSKETLDTMNNILLTKVKDEIDKEAAEKILHLSRQGNAIINEKEIRAECTRKLIQGINEEYNKKVNALKDFYRDLEEHKPHIFFKITSSIKSKGLMEEKMFDVNELINIQSILTEEEKNELHQTGIDLFNIKEFEKANQYFSFAIYFNKNNADLWFAKGMAEQNQGLFDEGLLSYSYALALAPQFLVVYLQAIECLILSRRIDTAKEMLKLFLEETSPEDYSDVKFFQVKVDQLKQNIDKK